MLFLFSLKTHFPEEDFNLSLPSLLRFLMFVNFGDAFSWSLKPHSSFRVLWFIPPSFSGISLAREIHKSFWGKKDYLTFLIPLQLLFLIFFFFLSSRSISYSSSITATHFFLLMFLCFIFSRDDDPFFFKLLPLESRDENNNFILSVISFQSLFIVFSSSSLSPSIETNFSVVSDSVLSNSLFHSLSFLTVSFLAIPVSFFSLFPVWALFSFAPTLLISFREVIGFPFSSERTDSEALEEDRQEPLSWGIRVTRVFRCPLKLTQKESSSCVMRFSSFFMWLPYPVTDGP